MTENERMMRELFMPIAVAEHHQMIDPVLSVCDICDRLGPTLARDSAGSSHQYLHIGC